MMRSKTSTWQGICRTPFCSYPYSWADRFNKPMKTGWLSSSALTTNFSISSPTYTGTCPSGTEDVFFFVRRATEDRRNDSERRFGRCESERRRLYCAESATRERRRMSCFIFVMWFERERRRSFAECWKPETDWLWRSVRKEGSDFILRRGY